MHFFSLSIAIISSVLLSHDLSLFTPGQARARTALFTYYGMLLQPVPNGLSLHPYQAWDMSKEQQETALGRKNAALPPPFSLCSLFIVLLGGQGAVWLTSWHVSTESQYQSTPPPLRIRCELGQNDPFSAKWKLGLEGLAAQGSMVQIAIAKCKIKNGARLPPTVPVKHYLSCSFCQRN